MSKIIRWQPVNEMAPLHEAMERLFEDSWINSRIWNTPGAWVEPTVDVFETAENVVVKAAVPGFKPEQVEVTLTGNTLLLSGEAKEESESKEKNYLRRETRIGSFRRMLELPGGLETEKADASFENGILTIKFPKGEEVKPRSIKLKVGGESNGQPKK